MSETGHHNHSSIEQKASSSHHHDANHQCQYCVVYAHVVPLPDMGVKEVLIRIQIRFLAFKDAFFHIFSITSIISHSARPYTAILFCFLNLLAITYCFEI